MNPHHGISHSYHHNSHKSSQSDDLHPSVVRTSQDLAISHLYNHHPLHLHDSPGICIRHSRVLLAGGFFLNAAWVLS